jgi:membrane-associated protease RseP (regulator of RpoE activity)
MSYATGLVLFALAILVSVCLHEAGHMLTAKMFGMKVTRYFVGFGPTLWSFRRGETEYGIKALPIGGFVKIVGMTPQDEDVDPADEPRAMWRYPVWKRTIVMAAGSVTHFILAIAIFYGIFVTGGLKLNPAADPTRQPAVISVQPCVVVANDPGRDCTPSDPVGPAQQGGLRTGDRIVEVAGAPTPSYDALVKAIRSSRPGKVSVQFVRDDKRMITTVNLVAAQRTPIGDPTGAVSTVAAMGVGFQIPAGVPDTVPAGPVESIGLTGGVLRDSVVGVAHAIQKFPEKIPKLWDALNGGKRDEQTPISVIGASRLGGETVQHGLWIVWFLILASLNLFVGLFNLLPLLPLDGGHIAIAWFERARSWLYRRLGRRDPGRVDYMRLMPITYVVVLIFGGLTLLTAAADIVNPITLIPR